MAELTFPDDEAAYVRQAYAAATTILEYGSGGSTLMGSALAGKTILSVESDLDWAIDLQGQIDRARLPSPAQIYFVDIGATGKWGRPKDDRSWRTYHLYPNGIWDEPFFRHPDLVLIDGRFRAACFAVVCMRITRPVTILFDDYSRRSSYHVVERVSRPVRRIGRMARFEVAPGLLGVQDLGFFMECLGRVSHDTGTPPDYTGADPSDPFRA